VEEVVGLAVLTALPQERRQQPECLDGIWSDGEVRTIVLLSSIEHALLVQGESVFEQGDHAALVSSGAPGMHGRERHARCSCCQTPVRRLGLCGAGLGGRSGTLTGSRASGSRAWMVMSFERACPEADGGYSWGSPRYSAMERSLEHPTHNRPTRTNGSASWPLSR